MTTTLIKEEIITDIRRKLDAMMGKRYTYSNGVHLFKKYSILPERERVEIITDQKVFDRTFDAVFEFLQFFKEENAALPLNQNGHKVSSVHVYCTKDYSKFQFIKGNRVLNERKIAKIIEEINNGNDMLKYYPIQVKENAAKRLEILDGQHRFWISKQLKRLVYFILVEEEKSLPDIAKINSNVEKWKPSDFINCFVENGDNNYKLLNQFLTDYGISLTCSLELLNKANPGKDCGSHVGLNEDFRNGVFKVEKLHEAKEIAEDAKRFHSFPHWSSRTFVIAIYRIKKAGLIPLGELLEAYHKRPEMLTQQANYKAYVNTLEQIVNVGKQKRIIIL